MPIGCGRTFANQGPEPVTESLNNSFKRDATGLSCGEFDSQRHGVKAGAQLTDQGTAGLIGLELWADKLRPVDKKLPGLTHENGFESAASR